MNIRKLRLQRGWSQQQLADMSGLNVRTIQRIERGQVPGLESQKSLAAVFEIDISQLLKEDGMSCEHEKHEQRVIEQVQAIKGFYGHLVTYLVIIGLLFLINVFTSPGYMWAFWPALGWGIGVLNHGLSAFEVFEIFGSKWEKKQIEKRLGRKL